MFDETPDKADSSAADSPIVERTEDQWRNYFCTLFRDKLDSIFEIAKQITIFHAEVNKNPDRWRDGWKIVCKRVVGIDHTTCSTYETIHKVFSSGVLADNRAILPARTHTLYLIARAFELHELTVSEAIEARPPLIHPAMTQEEGRHLLALAVNNSRREARERGPFEESSAGPTAAGSTTTAGGDTATNADEARAATKTTTPKKDKKADKKEVLAKDDDKPDSDDQSVEALIGSDGIFSWRLPKLDLNSQIKKMASELGDEYDERIVRHLLIWRAEHWKIFQTIAMWDANYGPVAVTIALRQLGYQPSIETMIV
jgi:hypothetical protein